MMELRHWQRECITEALEHYGSGQTDFLCLATPGAGKTTMSAVLVKHLFDKKMIDLVVCLSPSLIISCDFQVEMEKQVGRRFDGSMGSYGRSLTYQSMINLGDEFWALFKEYRVFVIFDEIHHCAGNDLANSNAWGETIISKMQGQAVGTILLTGTPWRSDSIPISLARYNKKGEVFCDYTYGLAQAIKDNVCRSPNIILIDNNRITLGGLQATKSYGSFTALLEKSKCSYQSLIENETLITYLLNKANNKLNDLRKKSPDAAGLIVTSSVSHAHKVHAILSDQLGETADIVTYMEEDAVSTIQSFKGAMSKWVISVGMISEGTNIPRLRVCCHLTRVKTELYFRQVLGRILRSDNVSASKGYLYAPAEPSLVKYSHRISEEVPEECVISFDSAPRISISQKESSSSAIFPPVHNDLVLDGDSDLLALGEKNVALNSGLFYEETLSLFDEFKQKLLNIDSI